MQLAPGGAASTSVQSSATRHSASLRMASHRRSTHAAMKSVASGAALQVMVAQSTDEQFIVLQADRSSFPLGAARRPGQHEPQQPTKVVSSHSLSLRHSAGGGGRSVSTNESAKARSVIGPEYRGWALPAPLPLRARSAPRAPCACESRPTFARSRRDSVRLPARRLVLHQRGPAERLCENHAFTVG